jgi:uncharacterized membrane protein
MFYNPLPWYIYIAFALLSSGVILYYVRKPLESHTKAFLTGLITLIPLAILACINKFGEVIQLPQQYLNIMSILMIMLTILSAILLIYGAYKNSENDSRKRKTIIKLIIGMITIILACALLLMLPT